MAWVPADIIVSAIQVIFAVFQIMFVVVTYQVPKGKTVMTGNEIDTVTGSAKVLLVQVWTACYTGSQRGNHSLVTTHEGPDIIAEFAVPFSPSATGGKTAYLVQTCCIPGFGNYFCVWQYRVFGDHFHHRWITQNFSVLIPSQNRGKIKTKAIDVHFNYPEMQTFYNELPDNWMVTV